MTSSDDTDLKARTAIALWIVLVGAGSVAFSVAFACATPFAALAAVSALALRRGEAFALVTVAWLLNQAVGFGILNYPRTPDSAAWGVAIGIAALAATGAVMALRRRFPSPVIGWSAGFALAYAVYEGVLFGATAILSSGEGAFSPTIVARILLMNLLALIGLALLHRVALAVRLLPAPSRRLARA